MKITAIIRNDVADALLERLAPMSPAESLAYLEKAAMPLSAWSSWVSVKIGDGGFRDRVDFNGLKRAMSVTMAAGERRGYRLLTFNCERT